MERKSAWEKYAEDGIAEVMAFAEEYRTRGETILAHALPLADDGYAKLLAMIQG